MKSLKKKQNNLKQLQKDILILGGLAVLLESTGKKMNGYIDNYDGSEFVNLLNESNIDKNDSETNESIKKLVNQYYRRVLKNISKN